MRKYWVLAFCVVAVALVAACGSGGPDPTPTREAPTPTADPTTTAEAPTPTAEAPTPTAGSGTLEVRVTDQPADAVSSILVTLKDIEVHVSGGAQASGWRTIIGEPRQFDLIKLMGVEEVLGSAILEPGRYQQIRFEVVEAVLTVRGNMRQSPVPGGKLRLVGGFDISPGVTTIVTLDFDAERSVVFRPGQGPS